MSGTHLGGDLGDEEGCVPVGHGGVQAVPHVHRDIDQLICSGRTSVSDNDCDNDSDNDGYNDSDNDSDSE